ncbi:general transcription factor II-I repeat domain-containing protein 2A-like [Watersipora subatra]|uniref:general transcription factor II-I repeat domain-containing protein 2A-like n=1 Tax=Watersipora subatra TaxID=2589382 RepID=UPI00355ADE90
MVGDLYSEFLRRFEDFKIIEDEIHLISFPFACDVDNVPTDILLELIDLQSDTALGEDFKPASLLEFYSSLSKENFPNTKKHARKVLVLFGSTYTYEQASSVMKFTKSKHRSSLLMTICQMYLTSPLQTFNLTLMLLLTLKKG